MLSLSLRKEGMLNSSDLHRSPHLHSTEVKSLPLAVEEMMVAVPSLACHALMLCLDHAFLQLNRKHGDGSPFHLSVARRDIWKEGWPSTSAFQVICKAYPSKVWLVDLPVLPCAREI